MSIRALPLALCIATGGALAETLPGTRLLSALDVSVFACAPNPDHRVLSSEADVARTLDELRPHCEPEVFRAREATLRKGLKTAGVTWGEETVVVVQDWYGTGMAKASLRLSLVSKGRLDASVVWMVPPPPVTPDTATCRFAFAVRNSGVREVAVTSSHAGSRTFQIPP